MKLFQTHKLPLALGYCLLIASMFFPFATEFGYLFIQRTPPYTGPPLANRITFWSFMHIQERMIEIEGNWVAADVQWLLFVEYWDWWGPGSGTVLPSSILIPIFILQILGVLLGPMTLIKADNARKILPLLLIALALNCLYFAFCQVFHSDIFIGFWLSILSSASIMAAVVYMRLSIHASANTSGHRSSEPTMLPSHTSCSM